MSDLGYYYAETYRAGEFGYYAPRKRGTCDVWHDSHRYIYTLAAIPRRKIRAMINGKVAGRYPNYKFD